jgi:hypothetical protein
MWTGIVRSVLPAESNLGEHAMAVQSITGSVATIDLYIDPDSAGTIGRPAVRVLRKAPGQPPRTEVVRMALAAPDKFSAEITLAGDEVIVPTIELDNGRYDPMAAVILPISPEHTTPGAWSGERLLRDLASATGGVERTDLAAIWDDLPRSRRITMLTPLFFGLAIVLLVAEVFHRRIGFPTVFHMKRAGALQEKPRVLAALRSPARAPNLTHPRPPIDRGGARSAPGPGAGPAQAPDTRTAPPPSPPAGTVLDAMTEIKKRRD